MIYLAYKIVDIYNFAVIKKSKYRENIRYEFLLICEKSTKRVWKCSGQDAYEDVRGNSSKSQVLVKKMEQRINSWIFCCLWVQKIWFAQGAVLGTDRNTSGGVTSFCIDWKSWQIIVNFWKIVICCLWMETNFLAIFKLCDG